MVSRSTRSEPISLSLKETLPDPWDTVDERYAVNDIVPYDCVWSTGAFAKLEDRVGPIHSQLAGIAASLTRSGQAGDEV